MTQCQPRGFFGTSQFRSSLRKMFLRQGSIMASTIF